MNIVYLNGYNILIQRETDFLTLEYSTIKKEIGNLFLRMIENFVNRIENNPEKIILDLIPTNYAVYKGKTGYYYIICF